MNSYLRHYIGCPCTVQIKGKKKDHAGIVYGVFQENVNVEIPKGSKSIFATHPDNVKPHLKELEDLTDDELTEIAINVLNMPAHLAHMYIADIKRFLCENTTFIVGNIPDGETPPLEEFEFTPQTFFNLCDWLLENRFDLYGLIPNKKAIHKV